MNQKGFALIAYLIVALLASSVIISGFFYTKNSNKNNISNPLYSIINPTPTIQVTISPVLPAVLMPTVLLDQPL